MKSPQPLAPGPAHALMHLTVFVWGFTAILGRLISLSAVPLVWYRLLVVLAVMPVVIWWRGLPMKVPLPQLRSFGVAGTLVALHWLLFYGCIKYAGVAVAVLCLSTITFFTALLEPLVFKRKAVMSELLIGFGVMLGVGFLVKVETSTDFTGLAMGMGSALFSSAFGTLNGKLARESHGEVMTFYELSAAALVTSVFFLLQPGSFVSPMALSMVDAGLLLLLGVGCTVLPWMWSLRVLQTLAPYALALAVSLEPVYAMGLAWFIFPGAEQLTWRFYVGVLVLLSLVVLNTVRRVRVRGR
ncbi:MAG: DMT family transporter [Archangium sp.]|nr:DMT family transporter [Archangium sp.]MDP3574255.1 DMT family transporter [Archangium sp.]